MSSEEMSAPGAEQPGEASAEGQTPTHEQLLSAVEDARAKADENWNQLLRTRAELDNLQRRAQRDVESAHKYALERFVQELLPVKDSLELGLAAASAEGAGAEKVREGVDLTLRMLASVFEKFGVKEINPVGERFNPEMHQAMAAQETAQSEPNTVLNVVQKGYSLNDRLVRPALVVVAKGGGVTRLDEHA